MSSSNDLSDGSDLLFETQWLLRGKLNHLGWSDWNVKHGLMDTDNGMGFVLLVGSDGRK